jgi:Sulfotransferase family
MTRTRPNFLVVGAARSGTTGLVEGLRSHPRVFVTDPKEPHFFALHRTGAHFTAPGDQHTINRVAVTELEAYLDLYPQEHDYLALGDASVSTLYYAEDAVPAMLDMNPDMKLVVMLREPVARAYSSHQYMRARGLEPVEDFLDAVALEEERKQAGWHHIWHYTSMSHYSDSLETLYAAFPKEQIGVWFYDSLGSDYEGTVSEILRFLEVPHVEGEATGVPRVNVSGQPKYAPVHRAIAIATGNERVRSFVKNRTSYRFRERIRRASLKSDPIPPGAQDELGPQFHSDLVRLRGMVTGPVPGWLESATSTR